MSKRKGAVTLLACATMWGVAACGGGDSSTSGGSAGGGQAKEDVTAVVKPGYTKMQQSLGKGEGQLNIVNWAGYAEDGSTDPKVDWVTPFEKKTGCQVNSKIADTSDEMVTLMRTGQYDGVSASGDATLRLIAGGDVAPVNTKLIPHYKDLYPGLKNKPWNSVDGQMYGVPHGRGANLLMWRTDKVKGNLNSWSAVFGGASKYRGHVTAYDSPTYIADAALMLKATRPDLKITNPYALDDKQFQAAVDLLKQQRKSIGEYWASYTKEQQAFASGDSVIGTTWQYTANLLQADKVPVKTTLPKEGATGWSDTWMISSKAKHPNCMYMWMDWIVSPKPNAQVAEWFGEAPANPKACALTAQKDFCKIFHADDEKYFSEVHYWTTPTRQCGDERGAVCKDYNDWVQAWTEIKG
jgi:putative spermidine/putrescine transport system substrate-binding protein